MVLASRGVLIATAGKGLVANFPEDQPWKNWFLLEGLEWHLIESVIQNSWIDAIDEVRKHLAPG